jgi:hypothetical protein
MYLYFSAHQCLARTRSVHATSELKYNIREIFERNKVASKVFMLKYFVQVRDKKTRGFVQDSVLMQTARGEYR